MYRRIYEQERQKNPVPPPNWKPSVDFIKTSAAVTSTRDGDVTFCLSFQVVSTF
jgi:hypothetical protein